MAFEVLEYMVTNTEGKNPGPFLKNLRMEAGLSLEDVAKSLKVNTKDVKTIESGKKMPVWNEIFAYLRAIKYSIMVVSSDDRSVR